VYTKRSATKQAAKLTCQVLDWALSSDNGLHKEAKHGKHS